MNGKMYTPLPPGLTIRESPIAGLGLFTSKKVAQNTELGMTHILVDAEWIRTPLGGFYNHNSEDPNCESVQRENKKYLVTLRTIEANEELTSRYNLYDPSQNKIIKDRPC